MAGARYISLLQNVQTHAGTYLASYTLTMEGLFIVVMRLRRGADHSYPFRANIRVEWSCTSTPVYALIMCAGLTLPFLPFQIFPTGFTAYCPLSSDGNKRNETKETHTYP